MPLKSFDCTRLTLQPPHLPLPSIDTIRPSPSNLTSAHLAPLSPSQEAAEREPGDKRACAPGSSADATNNTALLVYSSDFATTLLTLIMHDKEAMGPSGTRHWHEPKLPQDEHWLRKVGPTVGCDGCC